MSRQDKRYDHSANTTGHQDEETMCPVCQQKEAQLYTLKRNHHLYRCASCGLIFLWPIPTTTSLLYNRDYFLGAEKGYGYLDYEHDKKAMRRTFRRYLQEIERHAPAKGNILDVGAATGVFLAQAEQRGWKGVGIEISAYAAGRAEKNNVSVLPGKLEDGLLPENFFDVITLWDVFEHFPSPQQSVTIMRRLLKKKGLIALNTPNSSSFFAHLAGRRWHLIIPPEHVFLYTPLSLRILLEKNGFEIMQTKKIGKLFNPSYVLTILHNWQGSPAWRKAAEASRQSFIDKLFIPINLYDNMFVIARKQ